METDSFLYFGSGTKLKELSNFARCPVPFHWRGFFWNNSEAAYSCWAHIAPEEWHKFAVGGPFSDLATGVKSFYKERDWAKKTKSWGSKCGGTTPELVGILPKLATQLQYAKRAGVRHSGKAPPSQAICEEVFEEILHAKYSANESFRNVLIGTSGKTLIEFDRGAERLTKRGKPPLWTALVKDGVQYGTNLMGVIHMRMRDRFV